MNKITGRQNGFAFVVILVAMAVAVIIAATAYFVFKAPVNPLPKSENIEKQSKPEAVLPTESATILQSEIEVASTSKTTMKQKIAPEPETTLESKVAPVTASPPASQSVFDPKSAGSPHPKIAVSPPPCCNHPYWHKVYRAVSSDGLNFKEVGGMIKDKASVPAILQKEDGSFILYYVDGRYDTMDCSVSSDGINFSPGNCTIYGFTQKKAWDPYVVRLPNGRYRMYFVSPPEGPYATKIMSAISEDGINWLQEKGIRFQQPNLRLVDPAVIKMGNIWRMYVWYGVRGRAQIITATSHDGFTFTREREFQVGRGSPEIVRLDSGNYALYFGGNGIEMTTSSDGLKWGTPRVALPSSPSSIVSDPSVIKTKNGDWVMFYKKQDFGGLPLLAE